jgi:hypothetical protein
MDTFLLAVIVALLGVSGYFLKRIVDDTTRLKKEMQPIAPAIIEIQSKFTQAGHTILFPMTVAPGSPLHVTEYGDDLLKESGFYEILKDHGKELIQMVKDRKPATNYDIQKDSIDVIEEILGSDHDMTLPLKEYAYSKGVDLSVIALPAGIALRDEVMKLVKL